jgi:methionine synthase II (cobalamin-independent)
MKITTTCIGAYPKPGYIEIGNFAETQDQDGSATRAFTYTHDTADQAAEELLIKATQAAIQDQLDCGIDEVPADVTRVMHMCCDYPGHVDDEGYLKAAPDCGLMMLGRKLAMAKLKNMCAAAEAVD